MSAPTVVAIDGANKNAATTVGGTGTVSIRLMVPVSGQDGVVYAMARSQVYIMAAGDWVGDGPTLTSTEGTSAYYEIAVSLDDWNEVFQAPLPAAGITTLAAMRSIALNNGPAPSPSVLTTALLGAPGGLATLGQDGDLTPAQRPPATLDSLTDVDVAAATNGQFLSRVAGTWEGVDAPGDGGGVSQTISSGFITSGNVAIGGTGTVWTVIPGTEQSIAATVGDQLGASYGFGGIDISGIYFDIAVLAGGGIVRQLFSPNFPPSDSYEGAPGLIHDPNVSGALSAAPFFLAAGGDLQGGNCTFAIVCRGNPTGNFLMSPDVPVTYTLCNNH